MFTEKQFKNKHKNDYYPKRPQHFSRLSMLHKKNIDVDVFLPAYNKNLQRPFVWDLDRQRELVYSILLGKTIPPISVISIPYIENREMLEKYELIDGKQRYTTIVRFMTGMFHIMVDGVGREYRELSEEMKNDFDSFTLEGIIWMEDFHKKISDEDKFKWFNTINFMGTPQEKEYYQSFKNVLS